MYVEILPAEIASSHPIQVLEKPKPQKFEIRLIIWKCDEIPLEGQDAISIFIHVVYDPQGWNSDEVVRDTDTHMGSVDGHGVFNWRMKFQLEVPCMFPRLKISVQDMNVLSSDTSLG